MINDFINNGFDKIVLKSTNNNISVIIPGDMDESANTIRLINEHNKTDKR